MWTDAPSIGWLTRIQEFLNVYQRYFCFQIAPAHCLIKKFSEHIFHLFRTSTKITNNVKFPKSISSKDGVWREFLKIDGHSTFSKKKKEKRKELQRREFYYPFFFLSQLVVITWLSQSKFIFHPHFEKIRFTSVICDHIASVVGGPQYY